MRTFDTPEAVFSVQPAKLLTKMKYAELVMALLTEFSKVDTLLDTEGLLISRVFTPIIAQPGGLRTKRANGPLVPQQCVQTVVQVAYIAQHKDLALAVTGYLTGTSDSYLTKEDAFKRTLLKAIREQWGLLKPQKVVAA